MASKIAKVWGSLSPGEGRHLIGWRLSFEIDIPALSPQRVRR
jgi:hypothetical protein